MSKHSAVSAPFVRSPYNYDTNAASDESGLKCEDVSLTVQSFKEDCDINVILDRYVRTGDLPTSQSQPQFGDFTLSANDYHDALNTVIAAQDAFDTLPAKVRARFDNDPQKVLAFLDDDKNRDEAVELGLVNKPDADLSIASPPRAQHAGGGDAVEKSSKGRKDSPRPANADVGGTGDE